MPKRSADPGHLLRRLRVLLVRLACQWTRCLESQRFCKSQPQNCLRIKEIVVILSRIGTQNKTALRLEILSSDAGLLICPDLGRGDRSASCRAWSSFGFGQHISSLLTRRAGHAGRRHCSPCQPRFRSSVRSQDPPPQRGRLAGSRRCPALTAGRRRDTFPVRGARPHRGNLSRLGMQSVGVSGGNP